MRERSRTTPRRRGPKQPLPQERIYNDTVEPQESPYYTIDNTEDIYSTTLLPSQRCYIDPWDLENYDYVRKKVGASPPAQKYYETPVTTPSPIAEPAQTRYSDYYYEREHVDVPPRMAATMPRKQKRSHYQCQLECCIPPPKTTPARPSGLYDIGGVDKYDKYDDYMMAHMAQKFQNNFSLEDIEQNIYRGYGAISSTSSADPHSSIGEDYPAHVTLPRKISPKSLSGVQRRLSKPAPKLEFPSPPPPPLQPIYDSYNSYNPYATLPYCSVSDCYECLAAQKAQSIYGTHSIYGTAAANNCYDCTATSNTLGRRPSSSLYSGIYSTKFGMSKKGLLQIDYSCSWNDLDRVMGRNY